MILPVRHSPLEDVLARHDPLWADIQGMRSVRRFGTDDAERALHCGVIDLSWRQRFGCKGANAASWLSALGLPVPELPNRWRALPGEGLVARLGISEYLVEAGPDAEHLAAVLAAPPGARVYPVMRQDAALMLTGTAVRELFLQTCSFDFGGLAPGSREVVLTSMVGVGVTVLAVPQGEQLAWRLWCDGTYGAYLWETLVGIAGELGGGAVGIDVLPGAAAQR
jgi:sarcosine oxidase subunit gamma